MYLHSLWCGVADGWRAPYDLGSGLTWPDPHRNEAYDRGVNLGQWAGRIWRGEYRLLRAAPWRDHQD